VSEHKDPSGGETSPGEAGPVDVAVGLSKVFKAWLIGGVLVVAFIAVLLYGANRPANPSFVDARNQASTDSSGLAFAEKRIGFVARCLRVLVADTPEKRAQGLRNRDSLSEYQGMVFEFPETQNAKFTMSGVRFPLTIGFYDQNGQRVDAKDMEPCSGDASTCPAHGSQGPFRTALEVAKGQLPDGPLTDCPA